MRVALVEQQPKARQVPQVQVDLEAVAVELVTILVPVAVVACVGPVQLLTVVLAIL